MFFNKKEFRWWQKCFIHVIDFLSQIEILLLNMWILFKIPGFFQNFSNSRCFLPKLENSRFFQVKWQPCIQVKTTVLLLGSITLLPLASLIAILVHQKIHCITWICLLLLARCFGIWSKAKVYHIWQFGSDHVVWLSRCQDTSYS